MTAVDHKQHWLRLKMMSPLAHGDPAQADKSNVQLFRRLKMALPAVRAGRLPTQEEVDMLCGMLPVPVEVAPFLEAVSLPQFLGASLVHWFVKLYGGGEGSGLFSGMERYRRLEERFRHEAICANTLMEFWSLACASLQVGMASGVHDRDLLSLLSVPSSLAGLVLQELADKPRVLVVLGREWAMEEKCLDSTYARKAKRAASSGAVQELHFDTDAIKAGSTAIVQVPAFSANSARHEVVREPALWHLLNALDMPFGTLPASVAALFYNGGNIASGAVSPSNAYALAQIIRATYPSAGLLGGCTDSFMVGESNLRVNTWLECRENNDALALAGLRSDISVFELLDRETLTRHAGRVGRGQMPFSFETLATGCQVLVRFALTPYATALEVGALACAVEAFRTADATLGGNSARGFGVSTSEWHGEPPGNSEQYEAYLAENAEKLRAGLLDGTLGTNRIVCR
jgi:hypothetical protein